MNETIPMLPRDVLSAPETQALKYIGSKLKLLPHILRIAAALDIKTVLDGFSGSTRVSQAFAARGYRVISNDQAVWSRELATCFLLNERPKYFYNELIDHLNNIEPADGWFTANYGGTPNGGRSTQGDGLKKPWQIHNTRKLDAIREEIQRLRLPRVDRAVALTSLMLALDKVDSSLGHFASYLQEWSARSYKNLALEVPDLRPRTENHEVMQSDIFDVIPGIEPDLAYFDPPYGSNNEKMPPSRVRYSAYYHIWTSICLFDQPPLFGKARRRTDTSDKCSNSVFEEFRRDIDGQFIAVKAIDRLLQETKAHWILLSYSSGGRATAEELHGAIQRSGRLVDTAEIDYRRNVMAGMKWTNEWLRDAEKPNIEFLFLVEKAR